MSNQQSDGTPTEPKRTFVGRRRELDELRQFLDRARSGQGQVCFITGEAGEGKSAVLKEFMRWTREDHPSFALASAQCNAQSGVGDPYLPFVDLLIELVTGQDQAPDTAALEAVLEFGPDLVVAFNLVPVLLQQLAGADRSSDMPGRGVATTPAARAAADARAGLRQQIAIQFNLDELQSLCFDLGIDWDNLAGQTEDAKIRELLLFVHRHGRQAELLAYCCRMRPNTDWPAVVSGPGSPEDVRQELRSQLEALRSRRVGLESGRELIMQQYTAVLRGLAQLGPIVIALEDLQWSDESSLNLLFYLARNLRTLPMLIVGTYRPSEVRTSLEGKRHPLEQIRSELGRQFGRVEINLAESDEGERRAFLDALIDCEPNDLDHSFRHRLFAKTEGHALYSSELLRDMQERGDLRLDAQGRWVESPSIHWDSLPERVEDAIASRLYRLTDALRELLEIASVEGLTFTGPVLAEVQGGTEERKLLVAVTKELQAQHRLVTEGPDLRLGSAVISRFRFAHALVQHYVYQEMSVAIRRHLHHAVGSALERLYAERSNEIAIHLAQHFARSGMDDERATTYLIRAGERALQISAFPEAVMAFEQALDLLLDPTRAADSRSGAQRARVLLRLGTAHERLGQYALADDHLRASLAMSHDLGDITLASEALGRLALVAHAKGDLDLARDEATRALDLARETGNPQALAFAFRNLGAALLDRGELDEARRLYQDSLDLYRDLGDHAGVMVCLSNLGRIAGEQDDLAAAEHHLGRALAVAREIGDRMYIGLLLGNLGVVSEMRGDFDGALKRYVESRALAESIGDQIGVVANDINIGDVNLRQDQPEEALGPYRHALARAVEIEASAWSLQALLGIARVLARQGRAESAAELAGFVLHHPGLDASGARNAEDMLQHLREIVPSGTLDAAIERGRRQSLDGVTRTVLQPG